MATRKEVEEKQLADKEAREREDAPEAKEGEVAVAVAKQMASLFLIVVGYLSSTQMYKVQERKKEVTAFVTTCAKFKSASFYDP